MGELGPLETVRYLGWTLGLPPGLPGGEITGIFPAFGVGALMGSPTLGGQITPPDCESLSLRFLPPELPALSAQAFSFPVWACAKAADLSPCVIRMAVKMSLTIVFTR